jgi:DNA-binding response OmpR family regulator
MVDYDKVYNETKNFTVLYIEDNESFLKETTTVFTELFYKVDTAINGKEGLELYKSYLKKEKIPYDIVITDISMPHMNGIELIKEIYKIDKGQSIIVISAHDESKYLLELLNMGIEQFLVKPIDFDILLTVLFGTLSKITKDNLIQKKVNIVELKDGYLWQVDNSLLLKDEDVIKLTKKETFIMQVFIKNGYKVSTFQEILNSIYDEPQNMSDESLKPIISRLRKKIPKQTIENVYGLGYRLVF